MAKLLNYGKVIDHILITLSDAIAHKKAIALVSGDRFFNSIYNC
ncbi:hypothetical protein [Nostoc sp. PCC 7524]|nr:hypothetical protein [Nostoc sp. PCC 7524]